MRGSDTNFAKLPLTKKVSIKNVIESKSKHQNQNVYEQEVRR